jgi:hypothetical protein
VLQTLLETPDSSPCCIVDDRHVLPWLEYVSQSDDDRRLATSDEIVQRMKVSLSPTIILWMLCLPTGHEPRETRSPRIT